MENENFQAAKPNEPLMSKSNQPQQPHGKIPTVSVVEEDETKKKFLPQSDGDSAHYKKEFGEVEIKQPPKFIGLTQEELKKYADDPFWRKLRLALFALFWISWILMFVIAIILVVTSPKCPPKPQRHWWQKQLCYQAYTRSFKDSDGDGVGDFKGMKEKLNDLKQLHVKTIWPVPVIASHNFTGYDVTDFFNVDSRLGTLKEFTDLVDEAHKLGMSIVIDLPITTMSTESGWFRNSSSGTGYSDYFNWSPASGALIPGDIEFVWDSKRGQYYMTYGKQHWPVLNWNSADLRSDMKADMQTWLKRGVDGFYLGHVQLMDVAPDGSTNWERVGQRIEELREAVDSFKNETGSNKELLLFTSLSQAEGDKETIVVSSVGKGRLNYIINTELTTVNATCDAKCIRDHLVNVKGHHARNNETWPMWEIGNPYVDRVATRFGNDRRAAELLQMLLFMLEGSINTYYGDELGLFNVYHKINVTTGNPKNFAMRSPMQWDDGENAGFSTARSIPIPLNADYKSNNLKASLDATFSSAKMYKKMGEWRTGDDTFLFGDMEIAPPHQSIVAVKRNSYAGSMNYYAILNFANATETVNLKTQLNLTLPASAGEPTVGMTTPNLGATGRYKNRDAVEIDKITLEPYSGLVIKFKG